MFYSRKGEAYCYEMATFKCTSIWDTWKSDFIGANKGFVLVATSRLTRELCCICKFHRNHFNHLKSVAENELTSFHSWLRNSIRPLTRFNALQYIWVISKYEGNVENPRKLAFSAVQISWPAKIRYDPHSSMMLLCLVYVVVFENRFGSHWSNWRGHHWIWGCWQLLSLYSSL